MNTAPVVEACPNCGAPLDVDVAGACSWCHARIRTRPAAVAAGRRFGDETRLVPEGTDGCRSSAPFIGLILSSFDLLSTVAPVKEYMHGQPHLLRQIRALSQAVSAAGVRVRDGGLLKDSFDISLEVYTPEEIWFFELSFDVIALVSGVDGLNGDTRAQMRENIRSLDWYSEKHIWKKDLKKAGDGPVSWREFRAQVPHRG
jgi:hypothetical protein